MRLSILSIFLFLCAFVAFAVLIPIAGWTLPMKLYAAALTLAGTSFMV